LLRSLLVIPWQIAGWYLVAVCISNKNTTFRKIQ